MNEQTFIPLKESVTVEGITGDYVWYNAKILAAKMSGWEHDFQKLVSVMEARHQDHLQMIEDLIRERNALKSEIALLKEKDNDK